MKKILTKYGLFGTILVFLILNSCQQDDFYNEEVNTSSKNLKLQRLRHSDLEKHPKVLEKLETLTNKKGNRNARMVEVSKYGFIVDTDEFVYIEDESRHSYTFRVYRKELRTDLENLVLYYNSETQRYDAFLVQYVVDENDLQNILDYKEIADFTSKTNITPLLDIDLGNIITQSSFSYSFDCTYSVSYTQELKTYSAGVYGGIVWYVINVPVYTLVDCTYVLYDGVGGSNEGGGGSSGSGGSGTGYGGGPGNSGNNGNNNGNNNLPSGFTNSNTLLTTPVVKNPNNTPNPYQNLMNMLDPQKANLPQYINATAQHFNNGYINEVSYSFNKEWDNGEQEMVYGIPAFREGTATQVSVWRGGYYYSAIHLHPKTSGVAGGMFSWLDVRTLRDMYEDTYSTYRDNNDVSLIVLAPDPTNSNNYNVYAIAVRHKVLLDAAIKAEWDKWTHISDDEDRLEAIQDALADKYINAQNNNPTTNNLEASFLQHFSNYGISLYKLENNVWNQLGLTNAGAITIIPNN